ncbi:hypothetical protein Sar04_15000 [Salinispora arenicola]|uniref:Uncharacterized protein n=1 Tax=Salinispora arenicola TaxID=168697 RepID=A0ABQ4JRT2_SALAC|nr:hypothetical protein Sar04_15000 [Salinispora arenicola]
MGISPDPDVVPADAAAGRAANAEYASTTAAINLPTPRLPINFATLSLRLKWMHVGASLGSPG